MKKNGYKERLEKAALAGVISRLENDQAHYVVQFMSRCVVPEAVYESKIVRELSIKYLKRSFGFFGLSLGIKSEDVAKLMKAVRVPESEVNKVILDYFTEYLKTNKELPRNFEVILSAFPVPVAVLNNRRGIRDAAITDINSKRCENWYRRQRCFLKYFSLPVEEVSMMVRTAMENYASDIGTEIELDKFIMETKLTHEEVLSQLNVVMSELISEGMIGMVKVLMKKFAPTPSFILNDDNRKRAIQGANHLFREGEIKGAMEIMDMFALTKADFEEGTFFKAIESCLSYHRFDEAVSIILFMDLPSETMAPIVRRNLKEFVNDGAKKARSLAKKYGIGWEEVVRAAEDAFVEGLERSGSKNVQKYIDEFDLSKVFLASELVTEAAKQGLIYVYHNADVNDDIEYLTRTFGLSI